MNYLMVEEFLNIVETDDRFRVNIHNAEERLYFGYDDEVPDEVIKLVVVSVYIDWASEALGIKVN